MNENEMEAFFFLVFSNKCDFQKNNQLMLMQKSKSQYTPHSDYIQVNHIRQTLILEIRY